MSTPEQRAVRDTDAAAPCERRAAMNGGGRCAHGNSSSRERRWRACEAIDGEERGEQPAAEAPASGAIDAVAMETESAGAAAGRLERRRRQQRRDRPRRSGCGASGARRVRRRRITFAQAPEVRTYVPHAIGAPPMPADAPDAGGHAETTCGAAGGRSVFDGADDAVMGRRHRRRQQWQRQHEQQQHWQRRRRQRRGQRKQRRRRRRQQQQQQQCVMSCCR